MAAIEQSLQELNQKHLAEGLESKRLPLSVSHRIIVTFFFASEQEKNKSSRCSVSYDD